MPILMTTPCSIISCPSPFTHLAYKITIMYRHQRRNHTQHDQPSQSPPPPRKYHRANLSQRIDTQPIAQPELPFRIKVCIRVRPFTLRQNPETPAVTIENATSLKIEGKQKSFEFSFDRVFDPSEQTRAIQQELAVDVTGGLLKGYNSSIFAYGATGSGKTFTMFGGDSQPGLAQLCLKDIFDEMEPMMDLSDFLLKMTSVQLYNQTLYDLLGDTLGQVDLRQSPTRGIFLSGATQILVSSLKDAIKLLKKIANRRTTQATVNNESSSRSHAIIQLLVEQKEKCQGLQQELSFSKLSMIDLAGSEKAGTSLNTYESKKINQSLLVLGNCIHELARNSERGVHNHIPFRDSKLTRLLKDSLGGNTRTVMISTISPSVSSFDQTYNTLMYSSHTNKIEVKLRRNSRKIDKTQVADYAKIISELRCENERIRAQLGVDYDVRKYEGVKQEIERGFLREVEVRRRLLEVERGLEVVEFQCFKTMYRESKFGGMYKEGSKKKVGKNYNSVSNQPPPHHNPIQLQTLRQQQSTLTEQYSQIRTRRHQLLSQLKDNQNQILQYVNKKVLQFQLNQLKTQKVNQSKKTSELQAQRVQVNLLLEQLKQREKIISEHNKVLKKEVRVASSRVEQEEVEEGVIEESINTNATAGNNVGNTVERDDQKWFYSFLESLENKDAKTVKQVKETKQPKELTKMLPTITRLRSQDSHLSRDLLRKDQVPLPTFKRPLFKPKTYTESRRARSKSIKLKSAAKDASSQQPKNQYSQFLQRNINRYQSYKSKRL